MIRGDLPPHTLQIQGDRVIVGGRHRRRQDRRVIIAAAVGLGDEMLAHLVVDLQRAELDLLDHTRSYHPN